jgi:hypothetical protein
VRRSADFMGYSYNVLGPVCCALCAFVSATCFSRASPLLVSERALCGELSRCDDHILILLLLFFPLVPLPVLLLFAVDDMPDSGQLLSLRCPLLYFAAADELGMEA